MRKMVLCLDAGIVGTDTYDFYLIPDDISDADLAEAAWEFAVDHAEAYGIYPEAYREVAEDENDEENGEGQYSDSISGWWEEYDPERHDGKACGKIVWSNY